MQLPTITIIVILLQFKLEQSKIKVGKMTFTQRLQLMLEIILTAGYIIIHAVFLSFIPIIQPSHFIAISD